MIYSWDTEANGLLEDATKVHCLSYKPLNSTCSTRIEYYSTFFESLVDGDTLVAHNQFGYDLPLMVKLGFIDDFNVLPDSITVQGVKKNVQLIDTLALSRFWWPDLPRGHGLEPWAKFLGTHKPDIQNWDNLPVEVYVDRCENDCITTEGVFNYLCEKLNIELEIESNNLPFNVKLVLKTYHLMCQQERQGVRFDVEAAEALVKRIDREMEEIRVDIEPQLPRRPLNTGEMKEWTPPKIQFKKDGTPSAACEKWFDEVKYLHDWYYGIKGGMSYMLPFHEPIINSLPMELKDGCAIKDWLLSLGWKPTMFNYKMKNNKKVRDERGKLIQTSPKFNDKGRICPNLELLGETVDFIEPLVRWLSLGSRRSTLLSRVKDDTGWLNNPRLKVDGKLGGGSFGLTVSHRQKHFVIRNVPKADPDVILGKEFRALFLPDEGKVMVGADAKALEDCIKGHFVYPFDNGEYADKILDPKFDAHTENARLWNCTRTQAKSPGYALQYNSQPATFSATLGVSITEGTEYWNRYWDANWALREAIQETEREYESNHKKYIRSIDESKIVCRSKHSVFNFKCQSSGAKIMDLAGAFLDKWISERGLPAERLIYMHDEYQFQTYPEYAELLGELMVKAITKSGEYFKLNVPLTGSYAVGMNWSETH